MKYDPNIQMTTHKEYIGSSVNAVYYIGQTLGNFCPVGVYLFNLTRMVMVAICDDSMWIVL